MNRENKITNRRLLLAIALFIIFVLAMAQTIFAYFSKIDNDNVGPVLDVNSLFGKLENPDNPSAAWGTEGNPYLIYENRHLTNLYLLQNSKDIQAINENMVFQVSDINGHPCYVGGVSLQSLFEIPSIGSEDFPFISTFKGVRADNPQDFVRLPDNSISDTSVIGNIRVTAYEGQIDIGLFGNVGRRDPADIDGTATDIVTTGYIGNLLLSNIQISSDHTGDTLKNVQYTNFFNGQNRETNHVGILAGHAQYCKIENISVHFTTVTENNVTKAALKAFDITANESGTKYTTAGGIIGYYKQIIIGDEELPANSDGFKDSIGSEVGFGLGIVYSEDIWSYMERIYGGQMTQDSYDLQDTTQLNGLYADTAVLDGLNKTYFRVGVFTFVHSRQSLSKDRVARLWETENSNIWNISTTGQYTNSSQTIFDNAKKYNTTQLTYTSITSGNVIRTGNNTSSRYYYPNPNPFSPNGNYNLYRYMFVMETGGNQYALVKYGETVTAQKIDTDNFIIPEDLFIYYTFRVANSRTLIGTTPDGLNRYSYGASSQLRINASDATSYNMQYFCYGRTVTNSSGIIVEEERPLRIYDTLSYMYSSSATNYPEGVRLMMQNSDTNTEFRLQRSYSSSSTLSNYLRFTLGTDFITTTSASSATYIKIYAVSTTPQTNSANQTTNFDYNKDVYTPASGTQVSFDMSKNVLFYDGTFNSNNTALKYRYKLKSLAELNWPDNNDLPITSINAALKMADPTSYYYMNNVFYGILRNIPLTQEQNGPVIYAPRASIAFTVNGTGIAGDTARINVIVATDPSQLVDQMIEVSFMNTNSSGVPTGDRTVHSTFILPAVPGSPVSGGKTSRTTPIMVSLNNGSTYTTAYPNMNTLLIAYTVEVPSTNTRTYFLESSKGSANFVYCSVEKTASELSNPDHKNDVFFPELNGIDYVFDMADGLDKKIITVSDSSYIKSLIMPYFGLTILNENLIVKDAKNFTFNITRVYDTAEEKYYMYINIIADGLDPPNSYSDIIAQMNFNFYDATYFDETSNKRIYSDIVIMSINGEIVEWQTLY